MKHLILIRTSWSLVLGLLSLVSPPVLADQNLAGNVTITGGASTGNLSVTGAIDSDGNALTFGTQGGSFGAALQYQDNSTDTLTFSTNRNPASWLWLHSTATPAMRLDSAHQLILYQANGTTVGITLTPSSNSLKLGAHANATLTADANGQITAGGGFSVSGNFTNPNTSATTSFMGNVGIGTASPSRKLTVQGDGLFTDGIRGALIAQDGYSGSRSFLVLDIDAADGVGSGSDYMYLAQETTQGVLVSAVGTPMALGSGTVSMSLLASGNVGVGTPNPEQKLSVAVADSNPSASAASSIAAVGASGKITAIGASATYGWLQSYNAPLYINSAGNNTIFNGAGIGNVGIGTTTPNQRLSVDGNLSLGSVGNFIMMGHSAYTGGGGYIFLKSTGDLGRDFNIQNYSNAAGWRTNVFVAGESGNVGIGTASPGALLHVSGGALFINNANGSAFNALKLSYDGMGGLATIGPNSTGGATFIGLGTSNGGSYSEKLRITNTGNVGIGTTSPGARAHIVATTQTESSTVNFTDTLRLQAANGADSGVNLQTAWDNSSNSSKLNFRLGYYSSGSQNRDIMTMIANTGNVGIGTTNPYSKFTVSRPVSQSISFEDEASTAGLTISGSDEFVRLQFGVGGSSLGPWGAWIQASYDNSPGASGNSGSEPLLLNPVGGNVGIGTTNPTHKLAVNGTIRAKEVIVDTGWADYVFEEEYRLAPLAEVESHIKAKGHLPGIPSAAEVAAHGVSMGDMQAKLLSKVEELTLHLIAQEKRLSAQDTRLAQLEAENRDLRTALTLP